jgi:hypothetical protein
VSLERERATVEYDPRRLAIAQMVEAVRRAVILPGVRRVMERRTHPRRGRPAR